MTPDLSPDLTSAMSILVDEPSNAQAFGVLERYVQRRTAMLVDRTEWRPDIAQDVLLKLFDRLSQGTLRIDAGARGYVSQAIRNRFIDRMRQSQRAHRLRDALQQRATVLGAAEPPMGAALDDPRKLVERVAAVARSQRAERYRDAFDQDLQQVLELVFAGRNMVEIVCQSERVQPDTPNFRTVANRVYKRHGRLRQALIAASESLLASGQLDQAEAALLPQLLSQMLSCQHSTASAVPRADTEPT
ncbi:MAG: hypothetical protein GXP62_20170 [Oligoflexia bacterium]|nr:hypothetical protein [Oligoflexia bacterium]